jgi:hypothetical protein
MGLNCGGIYSSHEKTSDVCAVRFCIQSALVALMADGNHTVPPVPAKHILDSWVLSNPINKREVKEYVENETRDEVVQHLERVKTEYVLNEKLECWDVHTDKNRYWVITNPTNLYDQKHFPSLDYTISFHVGITFRVMSRNRGTRNESQKSALMIVWRKWEDAASSTDEGEEIEDFQSVGMKCRECLIQLAKSLGKSEMVPKGQPQPKRADFVAWSELIADSIAPGDSNQSIRAYLKTTSKSAWNVVSWLTHYGNAGRDDARFAAEATANVVNLYGTSFMKFASKAPQRCPKCGSSSIHVGYFAELEPNPYVSQCEKCGWKDRQESKQT